MYEVVIDRWAHGELDLPQVESWATFCDRVHQALAMIASRPGGGRQVAAFTSGGPVGVCMQRRPGAGAPHDVANGLDGAKCRL